MYRLVATVNSCITQNNLVNTRISWFHRLTVTYIYIYPVPVCCVVDLDFYPESPYKNKE